MNETQVKTVLIVDDSAMIRRLLRNIVVKNGFKVVGEANTGKKGFEKFKQLNPDIVTMDMVMDEMTGLESLKHILEFDPKANVIIVSSMGQTVIIRDAIVAGAKDFLIKPFDEKDVMDSIRKLKLS